MMDEINNKIRNTEKVGVAFCIVGVAFRHGCGQGWVHTWVWSGLGSHMGVVRAGFTRVLFQTDRPIETEDDKKTSIKEKG